MAAIVLVCSLQQSDPELQLQNIEHDIGAPTQPHLPVEHGWLVEHPHLTICRMLMGTTETPGGSVVGDNVVPSSSLCHPYWFGSKSGGSD